MRLDRVLAVLVAVSGFLAALWGPWVFERVSGHVLPLPAVHDAAAMAAWSGVAFLRVLGVLLAGLGTALWAATGGVSSARRLHAVLCATSVFAIVIVVAQQIAIWTNPTGWMLAGLFAVLATRSGIAMLASDAVEGRHRAAI